MLLLDLQPAILLRMRGYIAVQETEDIIDERKRTTRIEIASTGNSTALGTSTRNTAQRRNTTHFVFKSLLKFIKAIVCD